jgi:hypothetical protein
MSSGLLGLKGTEVRGEQGYEGSYQFLGFLIRGTLPKVKWS